MHLTIRDLIIDKRIGQLTNYNYLQPNLEKKTVLSKNLLVEMIKESIINEKKIKIKSASILAIFGELTSKRKVSNVKVVECGQ